MRRRRSIGGGFSPRKLFSSGAAGAWYDPSDLSTLFQDSTGTTPVTAVEQPVGLMLDKSQGLVLGSELVPTSYSGTVSGLWNISASSVTRNGSTTGQASFIITSMTASKFYAVSFTVSDFSGDSFAVRIGSSGTARQITGNGTFTFREVPSGTLTALVFIPWGGVIGQATITNISVKELPGNHALQATAGSRPALSARYNILLATETLATQSVTTVATTYKLSFTGAGSITLSGTATGTYSAGTNTITCTAGSLTLTVSGTVSQADLRLSSTPTSMPAYQRVTTATDYATAGFAPYLALDGTADFLGAAYVQSAYPLTLAAGVNNSSSVSSSTGIVSLAQSDTQYKSLRDMGASITDINDRNTGNPDTADVTQAGNKFAFGQYESSLLTHQVNSGTAVTAVNTNAFGTSANIFIGKVRPAGLFSPARIYGVVVTNSVLSAAQISSLRSWMGGKMGATL